ncbi:MAG: LD-carboxypeptidase [Bacteroidales bacterium]|nr:LD-carboxypeptidase [Bacteroidales bacterium]
MHEKKIMPPFLRKGDEVAIVSPAWAIDEDKINKAVLFLEGWGLNVITGRNLLKRWGPYAGTDQERISDLQAMTDNPGIKAIFCSRGGYGSLRIIGKTDFSSLKRNPKWYVGFSDITVIHMWLNEIFGIVSIHGEMPLNYSGGEKTDETFSSLHNALFGGNTTISWEGRSYRFREVAGEVTGGNLSLIYSLMGTRAEPATRGRIFFIEEVGEYLYHLDRMMASLKLSGKLGRIAGLIVGGLNRMEETKTPWGRTPEEIIMDAVSEFNFPVIFDFPAGHIPDNRAFYIGKRAKITSDGESVFFTYI